jgi:hypothetical protein
MPENYVGMMWAMQEKGLTEDPNKSVYQEIGNIKISDISNFHKNHIANKIYHLAIVASRDKISKEDMGRYGKVKELTLEELFGY